MSSNSFLFWSFTFAYLISLYILIKRGSGKVRTANDFSFGTQSSSAFSIGLSIFATYVSSIGFLAIPAKSYDSNWISLTVLLSIPLSYWIVCRFFIKELYNIKSTSMYDYLTDRVGPWATKTTTIMSLGFIIGRIAIVLHLAALFFSQVTSIDYIEILIGLSVVTTAYSCFGGFNAILVTDGLQAVLLMLGTVILLGSLVLQMDQSHWLVLANSPEKMGLGEFRLDFSENTFYAMFLLGVFQHLNTAAASQISMQQYKAAASVKEAKKAFAWGYLFSFTGMFLLIAIGTLLYAFFQVQGGIPENMAADSIVGFYIQNHMQPAFRYFIYVGLFSAAMSSLDSAINPGAVIFHESFVKSWCKSSRDEIRSLQVCSVLSGALGLLVALIFSSQSTILGTWWELSSFFGLVVTALMSIALLHWKISFLSFSFVLGASVFLYVAMKASWVPILPEYIGYIGTILFLVAAFAEYKLSQAKN